VNQIALSVDIEDWYHSRHVTSLDKNPNNQVLDFKKKYNKNYRYLERPILDILELFEKHKVKATFFIVADLIDDNRDVFNEIVSKGHEIACHELHHIEYIGEGNKEEVSLFSDNVRKSIDMLGDLSGRDIIGFRAPSVFFKNWMIEPLIKMGIKYDSSISVNSLYKKQPEYNPSNMGTEPIILQESLLEIPWPYLDILGFKLPAGGGPLLRYWNKHILYSALKQSLKRSDTTFYFHPMDISDDILPKIIMENREKFWRNKGEKAFRKMEYLLTKFDGKFATCQDIYKKHTKE
jgi:peptidoglycan/xylan/chitin deacetylase (PgdA/CDA1 family)